MAYLNFLGSRHGALATLLGVALLACGCALSTDGVSSGTVEDDLGGDDTPKPPDAAKPNTDNGKHALGVACQSAAECGSGFCAQGFCCDSPCSPGCASCGLEDTLGRCTPLASGAQPRIANACPTEAPTTCGFDGACDGAGGCRQHRTGTACGLSSCAQNQETPAATCNGAGQCTASAPVACAPFICGPRACATDCRRDDECTDNTLCIGNKCLVANATLVRFTVGTPQIDGVTDDTVWNSVTPIPIAKVVEGSLGNQGTDLVASFKLLWTKTELFVAVDVIDSMLVNDSADPLQDDAVLIAIDPNNSRGQAPDGVDDVRYVFGWNDGATFSELNLQRKQAVTFAFRDTSNGYSFEARIPWQTLGVTNPMEGMRKGLQVAVIDHDDRGNRDAVVVWHGTQIGAIISPALFGQIILGPS